MAHLQYLPGDPRLVDQLVYELKSKGIFDQFRKECIADVDTRPAYQNLRQRVESSVASFLGRQSWKPDLNKNQLREKLRKHLLDGNYLEQGVERIVDQVVNPKVASVFIPQVEDVVYNFLGIPRQKSVGAAETSNGKDSADNDLLPTDLEAVSPGSVRSNDDNNESMDTTETQNDEKMEVDEEKPKEELKEDSASVEIVEEKAEGQDTRLSGISELTYHDSEISIDKNTVTIPLPAEEIKLESIPAPDNSPPNIKNKKVDLEKIDLPREPNLSTDIPLPDEMPKCEKESFFKPINLQSEDDDTSSDSSLRRNMSPLTPIRNFNNENSCDAQQGFENDSDGKGDDKKEPSTFRFTIENKSDNSSDGVKTEKKDPEQALSYQFNNQVNINTFNTPLYEESSNSNNLQIDYESDANSKAILDVKLPEADQNSGDSKKDRKPEEKKSSHKSSHRSRDSHRHSSSKDKKSDSKHSSRDSSRHDKKSSKDEQKPKSTTHKERSSDRGDKKDSRESSKHKSSHKGSSSKDSKNRSSSSSKHSSKHDEKKPSSSSSHRDKDKERSSDKSKDRSKDSKSSSHRSDKNKNRKSSAKSKLDEKENKEKKDKKETDDHYSLSGRGNPTRRSTDRDSNDGSSSSKGSHNPSNPKSSEGKKDKKGTSKCDNISNSGDSTCPSDKDIIIQENEEDKHVTQTKRAVRVETHLKKPIATPPRLPFVPDVTLKKPRFAANLAEAKRMIKMRKFLEEEQKRMNQEAALLLEFQANVRPSLSQVYSSIPGPELEFACVSNTTQPTQTQVILLEDNPAVNETTPKTVEVQNTNEVSRETIPNETIEIDSKAYITEDKAEIENVETLKDAIAESSIAIDIKTDVDVTQEDNSDNMNIIPENVATVDDSVKIKQNGNDSVQRLTDNDEEHTNNQVVITEQPETPSQCDDITDKNTNILPMETELNDRQPEEDKKCTEYFEVTIITEEVSEGEETQDSVYVEKKEEEFQHPEEKPLQYFAEHEKYNAELKRDQLSTFFKTFTEKITTNKLFLINCDSYEENLIKEASEIYGQFEIVNYHKNGHLKLPKKSNNIVKNVNVAMEVILPTKPVEDIEKPVNFTQPVVFSPVKSECSFELSSDYDAKLEEMVNNTSRKEIMEIILGNIADESPIKMPRIDYCLDSNIESEVENVLKRKQSEVESSVNNNRHVLTPRKMRKLSGSDQISSTTEETEETANNNKIQNNTRSKYLGRAHRVGLPRPKKTTLSNSPSSDKSVENYSQNTCVSLAHTPNGRSKGARNKVQRYDTSDLYKPKLHYLSRRNNIS